MNIGYNDMNTYAPQPFVTPGPIVISGGGRPKKPAKADMSNPPYMPRLTRPAVMPPGWEHFKGAGPKRRPADMSPEFMDRQPYR